MLVAYVQSPALRRAKFGACVECFAALSTALPWSHVRAEYIISCLGRIHKRRITMSNLLLGAKSLRSGVSSRGVAQDRSSRHVATRRSSPCHSRPSSRASVLFFNFILGLRKNGSLEHVRTLMKVAPDGLPAASINGERRCSPTEFRSN